MITIHFFLAINNLKGYFEEYDGNKYLTIMFTSEYKKLMYMGILKKINKDIDKNYTKIKFDSNNILPLNILINIHSLVFVIRYQRVYINTKYKITISKLVKYKMDKVREMKINRTLWATPSRLVNLLDFKPEKLSIETKSNTNNDIKVHHVKYENGGFYLTIDNIRGYFNFSNNFKYVIC